MRKAKDAKDINLNSKLVEGDQWGNRLFPRIAEKTFEHAQVASFETKEKAVEVAKQLREKGYYSEVYLGANGYYAVTAGHAPTKKIRKMLNNGLKRKKLSDGAKPYSGEEYVEKVFPNSK
ncbi:MAG TPA: SPOR domain-containing protein [Calditrichia bacterium]|nr:SPOR domain-containing protein [Calditrichota bacterium]HQU58159.1 SPOR domain-containing protein [Saprospiraceae bacterium]HQV33202.1 SPOR domain-containing protein [Calditrichia bacterium]